MSPPSELAVVSADVEALCERGNVTWEELQRLELNSFERDRVLPYLTAAALCNLAEQARQHCVPQHHYPPLTYDEALIHRVVPLLIARLRCHEAALSQHSKESRAVTL